MTVRTCTVGLKEDDPYYLRMRSVREERGCSWAEASRIVYQEMQGTFHTEPDEVELLRNRLSAAEQVAKDTTSLRIRCTRAESKLADVEVELQALRALQKKVDALQAISALLGGDDG